MCIITRLPTIEALVIQSYVYYKVYHWILRITVGEELWANALGPFTLSQYEISNYSLCIRSIKNYSSAKLRQN